MSSLTDPPGGASASAPPARNLRIVWLVDPTNVPNPDDVRAAVELWINISSSSWQPGQQYSHTLSVDQVDVDTVVMYLQDHIGPHAEVTRCEGQLPLQFDWRPQRPDNVPGADWQQVQDLTRDWVQSNYEAWDYNREYQNKFVVSELMFYPVVKLYQEESASIARVEQCAVAPATLNIYWEDATWIDIPEGDARAQIKENTYDYAREVYQNWPKNQEFTFEVKYEAGTVRVTVTIDDALLATVLRVQAQEQR